MDIQYVRLYWVFPLGRMLITSVIDYVSISLVLSVVQFTKTFCTALLPWTQELSNRRKLISSTVQVCLSQKQHHKDSWLCHIPVGFLLSPNSTWAFQLPSPESQQKTVPYVWVCPSLVAPFLKLLCEGPKYKTMYSAESCWANARGGGFRYYLGQAFHSSIH